MHLEHSVAAEQTSYAPPKMLRHGRQYMHHVPRLVPVLPGAPAEAGGASWMSQSDKAMRALESAQPQPTCAQHRALKREVAHARLQTLSLVQISGGAGEHTCVGVEKVIARHARFAGNACRNNNQIAAFQTCAELGWARVRSDCDRRVAMAEVRGHAFGACDVVQCELRN